MPRKKEKERLILTQKRETWLVNVIIFIDQVTRVENSNRTERLHVTSGVFRILSNM